MTRLIAFALCATLATPATAQEDGKDQMSEDMRLLLEGLMTKVMPLFEELEGRIDDLNAYHMPEILPNGDIIIRRKTPMEMDPPDEDEIEL